MLGAAGVQSFSDALRAFEAESEAWLEDRAFRRAVPCDADFLSQSFPFSLHAPSPLWERLAAGEAGALVMTHVASPLSVKYAADARTE